MSKDITPFDFGFILISIPLEGLWDKIIYDNSYILEDIKKSIKKAIDDIEGINNEINILYYINKNLEELEKEDFKDKLELLNNEFNTGKYLNPYDIMYYFYLLCDFNRKKNYSRINK